MLLFSLGVDVSVDVCNNIVISVHIALQYLWLFACNFEWLKCWCGCNVMQSLSRVKFNSMNEIFECWMWL